MTNDDPLIPHINLKLALLGCQPVESTYDHGFARIVSPLVAQYREKERLLGNHLCPVDQRIQNFLHDYFQQIPVPRLPTQTLVLDRPGMARALSVPVDRDDFKSPILSSYRVKQGVLHNPLSDRRTTQGIFHVAEGGLPIPADKISVPRATFAKMLAVALQPPPELMQLPFTAGQPEPAECMVSLLLRPIVCPEVPGCLPEKRLEVRFFAPGSMVSNLDFVESIFGNGGDPGLPENDAALDVEHWTGHTGCVILAPHLIKVTKQAAGLPHWDKATERQRAEGMCWKQEDELYNNGGAFKLTCRDESGVIVTMIADNYFGYCKKEVKTQISYAANLYGMCEEEHAGGALAFASYDLGEEFSGDLHVKRRGHSYEEALELYKDQIEVMPEGHAIDREDPSLIYVPETAHFHLHKQRITWPADQGERSIKLLTDKTYIRPSGYKVRLMKPTANRAWRLVGVVSEGTLCHKPCTVSGGGKSEISKSIADAIIQGSVFVADLKRDFDQVEELINRDYSNRYLDKSREDRRAVLSPERSLGSVIKMMIPDPREFTPDYNQWLESIPQHIKELLFVVKRFFRADWGDNWRDHFSVDIINGTPGNELKCDNRKLVANYLRVGYDEDGSWRTFGLRKDFHPAMKIQQEDDITASVVVPTRWLGDLPDLQEDSTVKFVINCENKLFQRPDEAIHRGYDKQTESDFAQSDNFFSNYEPLTTATAREMVEDSIGFHQYTEPMRKLIASVAASKEPGFFVGSANPRVINGRPSKNPRYLQTRPDLVDDRELRIARLGTRFQRRLPMSKPVHIPVTAVLPGRRNNPPEGNIRPLAVFNPIHYLELPELFMEFICSMTGKSPSTTGAGSEGALTKGPFNALPPIIDLNNALVSWLLCGHHGFITAAGYVGPKARVDHDISLLVPEIWCRMSARERDPAFLIENHYLEKCADFDHEGRTVLTGRLGYRINRRFVHAFFGRVFNHPDAVFTPEMLRPEEQDRQVFVNGMDNIIATQKRVANMYFEDDSVQWACPPLKALLHIMKDDQWEGKGLNDPAVRELFTRECLLGSEWYRQRLESKRSVDRRLWRRHASYLERFLKTASYAGEAKRLGIDARLKRAHAVLNEIESDSYFEKMKGTLGVEPIEPYLKTRNT